MRGADLQEIVWFRKICNKVAGQIRAILRGRKTASICCVKSLNQAKSSLLALFLADPCRLVHHFGQMNEC